MIRPATVEDTPQMVQLLKDCKLFNEMLDYSEWSHPTLVCDASGVIVGFVQVLVGRPYAYMTEICVHPDWQNRKVASQLVKAIEDILRSMGIYAWCGVAIEENTHSQECMIHIGGNESKRGIAFMKVL